MTKADRKRILLVEDDELFRQAMVDYLKERYFIQEADSAASGLGILQKTCPDAMLLDITLPDADGIELLKQVRKLWPELPVIMLTAIDRIQTVVECVKLGAFDYLAKPIIPEELLAAINRATDSSEMKRELAQRRNLQLAYNREYKLIGSSEALDRVRKEIGVVAKSDSPVLIVGETGTGKELAAREIHARSSRANRPFVAINCGAIPKDLFETEFFGHKRGAFTGAHAADIGKFQLADKGTLLLDEISELPLDAQIKLLRVLEEGEFYPVGSTELVRVDVRVIASTNRALEDLVQEKLFREDLYFRLNVYTIVVPPLRKRQEDILTIAAYFMEYFNRKFGKNFQAITPEAQEILLKSPWHGNVRELRNLIERVLLAEEDSEIRKSHLLKMPSLTTNNSIDATRTIPDEGIDFEALEKNLLQEALRLANGNKTRAAKLLKMSPPTFYYRLEKFGIE